MRVEVTLEGLLSLLDRLLVTGEGGHVLLTGGDEEGDLLAAQLRGRALGVIDRALSWALEDRLAPVAVVEQPSLAVVNGREPGSEEWPPPETQPGWHEVRAAFAQKGYTNPEGGMRAWQFPGMDDPYWYSLETVEERRGKLARVLAAAGPGQAAAAPAQRQHGTCQKCGGPVERRETSKGRPAWWCVQRCPATRAYSGFSHFAGGQR